MSKEIGIAAVHRVQEQLEAKIDQMCEELAEKLKKEGFNAEEVEEAISTGRHFWEGGANDALDSVLEELA